MNLGSGMSHHSYTFVRRVALWLMYHTHTKPGIEPPNDITSQYKYEHQWYMTTGPNPLRHVNNDNLSLF